MPEILWHPSDEQIKETEMFRYRSQMEKKFKKKWNSYSEFHGWSVEHNDDFWSSLFSYYGIVYEGELIPACTDQGFDSY
ncbi:MAG: hypothetical protein COW00_03945, partial [Bdellovibrio sp. CG12_big_fil_rev_8_21_14_0_65_39_13]